MANPEIGTSGQRSGSCLASLRRFTELVLAELDGVTKVTRALEAKLAVLHPADTSNPDLPTHQPFGLVFQEGQRAAFNLPSGRRFIVEYVKITCWGPVPHLLVQLTTQSQSMFRNMMLCSAYEDLSGVCTVTPASPLHLWESTANTLLFSYGDVRHSATVPADTCVQMWGYLEPTSHSVLPRCIHKPHP
ncbi:MAG: hypothetical protein WAM71_02455 [Candidatus Korobacteraceae bacterium]